jgi:Flp pilus assembly protein TadG
LTRRGFWRRERASIARFGRETRGATVVEFAIIAPVMGLMLLGAFDVAHTLYMRAVLQGVLQKAARDSSLQNANDRIEDIDKRIRLQVTAIANNGTIEIKRRFYRSFSDAAAARAEEWTDTNANGKCDAGEPYTDSNLNHVWDADGGNGGQGGARDSTLYTVTVSYPRFFPLYNIIDGSHVTRVSATTVLRNQPYADQGSYGTPEVRNCT